MAYPADEIKDCDEGNWDRISLSQLPSIGERILIRGLKLGNPARKASVGKYLATIKTVQNPYADKQAQGEAGDVWDVADCVWSDKYPGFIQTLKLVETQTGVAGATTGWNDKVAGDGTTTSENIFEKVQEKNYFDQSAVPTVTLQETGIIRTVQAAIDRLKRWRVSVNTTTAIARNTTDDEVTTDASVFETEKSKDIHNVSKASIPAASVSEGVLTRVRAVLNRFGLWDATISTTTAVKVTTDEIDTDITVFDSNKIQTLHNYTKVQLPAPIGSGGVLKRIRAAINRVGLWDATVTTKTSTYSLIVFPFKERSTGETVIHYIARNETPLVVGTYPGGPSFTGLPTLATGYMYDPAGTPSRNDDGTWNWHIIYRRADVVASENATYTKTSTRYRYRTLKTTAEDTFWIGGAFGGWAPVGTVGYQRQKMTTTITHKTFSTADAAWAWSLNQPQRIDQSLWITARTQTAYASWEWDDQSSEENETVYG